ncbi:MAG: glycine betaine ABC transporter substrate-binding protein, partial [Myxococcota bacterium]
ASHSDSREIRIGAKPFSESLILAELVGALLEEELDARVSILPSLGSTVAYDGVRSGDVDAYVDYSGTVWAAIMKRNQRMEREALYEEVQRFLEQQNIRLIGRLGFENTYAIALTRAKAQALGVKTLSALSSKRVRLKLGTDYEFQGRDEYRSLTETYGFEFDEIRPMAATLMYEALKLGEVDLITAYSTDGRIKGYDLVTLQDDEGAIPPYDAILLTSEALHHTYSDAAEHLARLVSAIDGETMRRLNFEVDEKKRSAKSVAREFLRSLPPR